MHAFKPSFGIVSLILLAFSIGLLALTFVSQKSLEGAARQAVAWKIEQRLEGTIPTLSDPSSKASIELNMAMAEALREDDQAGDEHDLDEHIALLIEPVCLCEPETLIKIEQQIEGGSLSDLRGAVVKTALSSIEELYVQTVEMLLLQLRILAGLGIVIGGLGLKLWVLRMPDNLLDGGLTVLAALSLPLALVSLGMVFGINAAYLAIMILSPWSAIALAAILLVIMIDLAINEGEICTDLISGRRR
ncbi:MAG: hypothetical protein Alpg2KO_02610 [Alphaproteobacteria bacterium]